MLPYCSVFGTRQIRTCSEYRMFSRRKLVQSCGLARDPWGDANVSLELPGQMRLIKKAGFLSDVAH